ncbi:MAG: hypothetical protein ACRDJS_01645 [Actinomycetota bacterium]
MRLRICLVLTAALSISFTSSPAAAGGYSWMDWEERYHAGHISIGASKDVWFKTSEAAEQALTGAVPYFVYLDDEPYRWTDRWHGPGRDAVRVGKVEVTENGWGGNIVNVRTEFEVPRLPSGTYTAYFCDWGCRHVMTDLYPVPFKVVQSPVDARMQVRMDALRHDLEASARKLRRFVNDVDRKAVDQNHDMRIDLAQDLNSTSNDLDRRIDRALDVAKDRNALQDSAAWFAAGFAAAVALAFVIRRHGRGFAAPSLEDELTELTGERVRVPLGRGS